MYECATNLWIFRKWWWLCSWVDIIRSDDLGNGNYYVVDTAGIQAWLHCAFSPLLSRREQREAAIRLHWHMVLVWPVRCERHACANWWWCWWCQQGNRLCQLTMDQTTSWNYVWISACTEKQKELVNYLASSSNIHHVLKIMSHPLLVCMNQYL